MMASDRTKILFSTDRAADSGTMPYTLKAVAAPRKSRVFTRHSIEFIDENGGEPCASSLIAEIRRSTNECSENENLQNEPNFYSHPQWLTGSTPQQTC
jgi:hypothetical protein